MLFFSFLFFFTFHWLPLGVSGLATLLVILGSMPLQILLPLYSLGMQISVTVF